LGSAAGDGGLSLVRNHQRKWSVEGARGGVDLPSDVVASIRRKVGVYYHKMKEQPPWDSDGE